MSKFIFDVDGTLTPSRQPISEEFEDFFLEFAKNNAVYLVTGSDRDKTLEQLGPDIYNAARKVYNCSGNDVWQQDVQISNNNWVLPEPAHHWLSRQLIDSRFHTKTGRHFEHRTGVCNFSVVGRNAGPDQRMQYVYWDLMTLERQLIANSFNGMFPELVATVGGETGLDIHPVGRDKSQILADFVTTPVEEIFFFGDSMKPGGNDYSLSQLIPNSCKVSGWEDTHAQLHALQRRGVAR